MSITSELSSRPPPPPPGHQAGKQRYTSVVEGVELANDFARSRLGMTAFARERGVSLRKVEYWSMRARQLAAAAAQPELVHVATVSADGAMVPVVRPAAQAAGLPVSSVAVPTSASLVSSAAPVIEVRLANGVRIGIGAGFSPEVLAQVIACVGGGRSC